jgi:hypothetical protein
MESNWWTTRISAIDVDLFDISFSVNRVYQYSHAPQSDDWSAVKCTLWYVHDTIAHGFLI